MTIFLVRDDSSFDFVAHIFSYPNLKLYLTTLNSSNGREVKTFASGAVNSGLMPSQIKPMTLKVVFTASLLDAQH